jgi:hypothetical protein
MLIPICSPSRTVVRISDAYISDTRTGVTATATYELTNAGVVNNTTSGGTTAVENWVTPTSAAGAAYEVYVTNSGDPLSSGTTGSWLALSTSRTWTISKAGPIGFVQADLAVQIRNASTLAVLDTASVTLYAEKF